MFRFLKKKFTLIELIVVIAVLGILSSIVIPNIGNIKYDANEVAMKATARNTQTALDRYALDNSGKFPVDTQPTEKVPQLIDFTKLYPNYLRDYPEIEDLNYWVDFKGIVWMSSIDAPTNVKNTEGTLTWDLVEGAERYNVYEIIGAINTAAIAKPKLEFVAKSETNSYIGLNPNKNYIVSSIDFTGKETVPVGEGYFGIKNRKPKAIISKTPNADINSDTEIAWSWSNSIDPDGENLIKNEWKVNGVLMNTPPTKFVEGEYTIELRVQDSRGLWSDWDTQQITVSISNHKPKAVLTMMPERDIKTTTDITWSYLNSTDSDSDKIDNVEWKLNDVIVQEMPSNLQEGLNTIEVRVQDSRGLWSDWVLTQVDVLVGVKIKQIDSGYEYIMILFEDGTIKGLGNNHYGQLGDGHSYENRYDDGTTRTMSLVDVIGIDNAVQISSGENYTLALLEDGTVKVWGQSSYYALGNGSNAIFATPLTIQDLTEVKKVVANKHSGKNSMVLMNDGTVKVWGKDFATNDTISQTPIVINGLKDVQDISLGGSHALFLMKDGTVKSVGSNYYGSLGDGSTTNRAYNNPTTVYGINNAIQIGTGSSHSIALLSNGMVKTWGCNYSSQIGDGGTSHRYYPYTVNGVSGVKQIAGTYNTSYTLLTNGTLKGWGYSGVYEVTPQYNPAVSSITTVHNLKNIDTIMIGQYNEFAKTNEGEYIFWGRNNKGQMGTTNTSEGSNPKSLMVQDE